jgi:hypothetical protein
MDITNNVSLNTNTDSDLNSLEDDKIKNKKENIEPEELEEVEEPEELEELEEPEQLEEPEEVEETENKKSINSSELNYENSLLSDTFFNEVLEGTDSVIDYKNFDLNDLNKNKSFNKLSNHQKTLVINRILEKTQKVNKTNKSYSINKESYNYCKTCGYFEKIKNKTSIFTRGNEKKNYSHNLNFIQYKYDPTLPNTLKYNCINNLCETHKNPKLKNAKFFRNGDSSYNIKYLCNVCNSSWNTFIER